MMTLELESGGVPDARKSSANFHRDEVNGIWSQNQFFIPKYCQKSGFPFDSWCSGLGNHIGSVGKGALLTDIPQQGRVTPYCSSLLLQHYGEEVENTTKISGNSPNVVQKGHIDSYRLLAAEIPESCRSSTCSSSPCPKTDGKSLTAEEILRVAGNNFILSGSLGGGYPLNFLHPAHIHYSDLYKEQISDIALAGSLFSAAESVVLEQSARATRLLNNCDLLSSRDGSTVQRVVHYFSEALRERNDRQSGNLSLKGSSRLPQIDQKEATVSAHPAILSSLRGIPFSQPLYFAGIQAIVENVANAKKVHVIDFGVRFGVCWTILIQALASRDTPPIEALKLTAVGAMSKPKIEEAGKRLSAFAQSLNVPFTFSMVMVDDLIRLNENLFELEDDEAVAVYAPYVLLKMLCSADRLDHVMRVIRCINPCILVMIEIEANTNTLCFGKRFTEALFYYSAYFDCVATCMGSSYPARIIIESLYCGQAIRNILTAEGAERTVRHVKLNVWRTFFARFGYSETKLSRSSLYQAELVLKEFSSGGYCDLKMTAKV